MRSRWLELDAEILLEALRVILEIRRLLGFCLLFKCVRILEYQDDCKLYAICSRQKLVNSMSNKKKWIKRRIMTKSKDFWVFYMVQPIVLTSISQSY